MVHPGFFILLTMVNLSMNVPRDRTATGIQMNYQEYWVSPRTTYESFRVRVTTTENEPVIIEKATASCGCVLVTIQGNRVTRERPGDIYVAIVSKSVDALQPVTIDVYTSDNKTTPKRINIRRAPGQRLK